MGPAHVALAWRQVACVCACVAFGATDGWGPRACVAKQKKGGFNPRQGGFEPGTSWLRDEGASHWARVQLVIGSGVLGFWDESVRKKIPETEKFSTGLTGKDGRTAPASCRARLLLLRACARARARAWTR